MRKSSSIVGVIIMLLTVAFIAVPKPAAAFVPTPEPKVWDVLTDGVTGEVVGMGTITTKPGDWYQLKSDGLKIDGASKICYPFKEGRFGWTGAIFQMVEGAWVKLATTIGWVPTIEGSYKACAQAPAAGTYALFAYFDEAKAPVAECQYDLSGWSLGMDSNGGGDYFYVSVGNLPHGTYVSYVMVGMSPAGSITGAMSGSATAGNLYPSDADFIYSNVTIDPSADYAILKVSAEGCTVNLYEYFDIQT